MRQAKGALQAGETGQIWAQQTGETGAKWGLAGRATALNWGLIDMGDWNKLGPGRQGRLE